MSRSFSVGSVDLIGIVTTAVEVHNLFVGHILHQLQQLRVLAEEVLAGVGTAVKLVVLQLAVTDFIHTLDQQASGIFFNQSIPVATPDNLDHIPASAAEDTFQLLDNFAVTAHRAIEALQVTVNYKDQVLQLFAASQGDSTQAFRLITLTVAEECPYLAITAGHQASGREIAHNVSLVDCLDWTQTHGYGRELPVVRHQPGVRVGRQTTAVHFATEVVQLLFAEATLKEGACIHTGSTVALEEDQITQVITLLTAEEVVKAHIVESCRRGEAGNMTTDSLALLVGTHYHRQSIPADYRANTALHKQIAGHTLFAVGGDSVVVGGGNRGRQFKALFAGMILQLIEEIGSPIIAMGLTYRVEGFKPFFSFNRIQVLSHWSPARYL